MNKNSTSKVSRVVQSPNGGSTGRNDQINDIEFYRDSVQKIPGRSYYDQELKPEDNLSSNQMSNGDKQTSANVQVKKRKWSKNKDDLVVIDEEDGPESV